MRRTILATKVKGTDETGDDVTCNVTLVQNPEWRKAAPDESDRYLLLRDDDEINSFSDEEEARGAFDELVEEVTEEFRDVAAERQEARYDELIAISDGWIVGPDLYLVEAVARAIRDGKSSEMLQAIKQAEGIVA